MKRLLFALILAPIAIQAVDSGGAANSVATEVSNKASSSIGDIHTYIKQEIGSELMEELSAKLPLAIKTFIQSDNNVSNLVNELAQAVVVNKVTDAVSKAVETVIGYLDTTDANKSTLIATFEKAKATAEAKYNTAAQDGFADLVSKAQDLANMIPIKS